MKIGTVFDATVRDLTSEGQAVVGAPNGCTVFVSGLWLAERGRMRITALKGRVGFAELLEVLEPAAERRVPPCKHQGAGNHQCGACPWMFVPYAEQLNAKQKRVEEAMRRIDVNIVVNPIWPSESEFSYRNRVQFKTDGQKLGFVGSKSNQVIDIDDCLVLTDPNRFSLKKLREKLPETEWKPSRKQKWTTLDLDEQTTAANVSINKRLSFQQANTQQNHRMGHWLREKLECIENKASILELFCGNGNFTKIIRESGFEKIVAVEGQSSSIEELKEKNLQGVEAKVLNLFDEKAFSSLMHAHRQVTTLLLDPPRDGLKCREGLFSKKSKLKDVFYISCNLATFSRDLKSFMNEGYKVKDLQALDQFPQTPHIELLCHLSR